MDTAHPPRNYKHEQERKLGNFFSRMFVMAKKVRVVCLYLNGIPASVKCVSSMIVVLNAKFARLIAATVRNEEAQQECRVLLVKTQRRSTCIAVLTVHAKTNLLYTFQRSMQANRNINL